MKASEFDKVVEEVVDNINKVLKSKAEEYSSEDDRLHNFVEASKFFGTTKVFALTGMMNKHVVSVYDMVKNYEKKGKVPSDYLLNEKIGDAINYLILLKACFLDIKNNLGEKSNG